MGTHVGHSLRLAVADFIRGCSVALHGYAALQSDTPCGGSRVELGVPSECYRLGDRARRNPRLLFRKYVVYQKRLAVRT